MREKSRKVGHGRAMKHLILSFLLFMALCLPVLAGNQGQNGNGQGQNGNGQDNGHLARPTAAAPD
jgi:hypothetical protein